MNLPAAEAPHGSTVAIVGMAGRFPGAADPSQLWDISLNGRDVITRRPATEIPSRGSSRHIAAAGVLPGIDAFDAGFFSISAHEADRIDPQQRLLLECAWETLVDAGCVPGRFNGAIGVFAGVGTVGYGTDETSATGSGAGGQSRLLAVGRDFAATRIAHRLDLHGPALTVQTACSTSLVAVHLGVQSLLAGDSDAVLAGAAAIRLPHHDGYVYQPGGIFAADGRCRPFSADAQGTVPGSGVAMVLLKRLADAVTHGDHIYAVIKGSAVNNDGRAKQSFSAPSVAGQLDVITTAHRRAGVDPATVGYMEAHGTATPLGDEIEFDALGRAFRIAPPGACALGSVKANVGHLDVAAGVTGLIKAALVLRHGRIPPALYCETPHPALRLKDSPFRLPMTAEPWPASDTPRRAAVSSFGVGGTNAHVVLEEAPPSVAPPRTRRCHLLLLSERSPAALRATAGALATRLPEAPLAAVSSTLVSGRAFHSHRWSHVAVNARSAREALLHLADHLTGESGKSMAEARPVLVLPHSARLSVHQLRELAHEELPYADQLRQLTAELDGTPRENSCHATVKSLASLLPGAPVTTVSDRLLSPTASFAATLALARLLLCWGVAPARVSGTGSGAIAAVCVAGVLTVREAVLLAEARDTEAIRRTVAGFEPRTPHLPCRSDLTGADLTAAQAADPDYWVTRRTAVTRGTSWLLPDHDGPRLLLGAPDSAGTGRSDTTTPDNADRGQLLPCLAEPDDRRGHSWHLLATMGRAWEEGVPIDPEALDPKPHRHIPLPSRPFERRRHWTDPVPSAILSETTKPVQDYPARTQPPRPAASVGPSRPHGDNHLNQRPAPESSTDGLHAILRQITASWAEALGLADVAPDDDFTELGGDSLLALEVSETLGRALDQVLTPELLLNHPTPRGLAERLLPVVPHRSDSLTAPAPAPSLTLLATRRPAPPAGTAGTTPLFLVHPVGGSALVYRDLAEALAPDVPVYGFTAPGLFAPGDEPLTDLAVMARMYAEELLTTCPSGPFWVGGSSYGGVVAHEMARLLDLRQRPPGGTLLLDSPWPPWVSQEEASAAAQSEQVRTLPEPLQGRVLRARLAHTAALRAYTPAPRSGPTVYVSAATGRTKDGPRAPEEGWASVIPNLVVETSPGGHESMLVEPHSSALARCLNRYLRPCNPH
ncbi:beta-ketoacyl synthase N-terminal-like domain-containing protein [Streptomyces sp. SID8352]|uniref:type I polyketide synthase n=1 Tax=Streptomyces sp. SID8352 TaxID=2690338 RepID=UPI00136FBA71|nr:beta-ketoacyl synthase N-terminal-like domain-containing protein [Streptomyces sp. SID8352]MYU24822.1 hypothetical protein [Streptomyces sp. SID8352]